MAIYISVLVGCDTCGSPNVKENEMHCDPCLIKYFEKLIDDVKKADHYSENMKNHFLSIYQPRLDQLINRN